nr:leucyl/phenylalanyl-tRNA--protein transferase [uncultured Holophaga sp.]
MPVFTLSSSLQFPDPRLAEPDGLLAVGGDLSPERLLLAYRQGIFPWFGEGSPILWWCPLERAVFLAGDGHLSRRAQRALRQLPFELRWDTCFPEVIRHCAQIPRPGQDGTWITEEMEAAYTQLHQGGHAHSVEVFREGHLVGGLYGIQVGACFCGESMFSLEPYASRAAFQELCGRAWARGFRLIDGQLPNPNLSQLGARTLPRQDYLGHLAEALRLNPVLP